MLPLKLLPPAMIAGPFKLLIVPLKLLVTSTVEPGHVRVVRTVIGGMMMPVSFAVDIPDDVAPNVHTYHVVVNYYQNDNS